MKKIHIVGSNQRPVKNMVVLFRYRSYYSLFFPNSPSFHLPPAAVRLVPVNSPRSVPTELRRNINFYVIILHKNKKCNLFLEK